MTGIKRFKTGSKYEERNSYSRAVRVGQWVLMANTAGRDQRTGVLSTDPVEQARTAVANVEHGLVGAGSSLNEVVRLIARIPNPANVRPVMDAVGAAFRGIDPAMTIACTPLASLDYAVELEATAFGGAESDEHAMIAPQTPVAGGVENE